MEKIVTLVTSGKATVSQGRHDDDFSDRLSSRYTPLILLVFTVLVTIQQLVRNPITCWAPVHFTESHGNYANQYCWVRNTYYLPYEDHIPRPLEDRQMLTYYQWIQFILLAQAIFFFAPTLIWRTFNSKAGVDADNILHTAHEIPQVQNAEKKDEKVSYLAGLIDRFLESRAPGQSCQCDFQHLLSGILCRCCGRRVGNYLVLLYMFQKLLFILNIVLQFLALSAILGNKYYIYGAQVVKDPIPDHEWNSAHYVAFPRVTMCDFRVRRLGNTHRYTLQCVLPLNLYIEKIYIFLWFWMIFVLFMLVCSFIMWLVRFCWRKDRLNFIKNHLNKTNSLNCEKDHLLVEDFVENYLRQDGSFLLRLVATNTNHVSTSYIITGVWDFWCQKTGRESVPEVVTEGETASLMENEIPPPTAPLPDGLTHRHLTSPDSQPEKPPRRDVARAPTMYVRGTDTLGSKIRPDSDLYPEVKDRSTRGDDTRPSAPPSDETGSTDSSEPHTTPDTGHGDHSPTPSDNGPPPPAYNSAKAPGEPSPPNSPPHTPDSLPTDPPPPVPAPPRPSQIPVPRPRRTTSTPGDSPEDPNVPTETSRHTEV